MEPQRMPSGSEFVRKHLLKTVLYLLTVIALILAGKHFFKDELDQLIELAQRNLPVFYIVFFLFEILPGQLPPEIFFVFYSRETTSFPAFIGVVSFLGSLSYAAINLSYYVGKLLRKMAFLKNSGSWLENNRKLIVQYGSVIIVLGMFTPLPSSFISMAAGYLNFPVWKFRLLALARFLRFFVYGAVIYFST